MGSTMVTNIVYTVPTTLYTMNREKGMQSECSVISERDMDQLVSVAQAVAQSHII